MLGLLPSGVLESGPGVPRLRLTSWTSPGGDARGCPVRRAPCVSVACSPAHLPVLAGTLPTPAQHTRMFTPAHFLPDLLSTLCPETVP